MPHGPFRFGELSGGAVGRSNTSRQACVFLCHFSMPLSEYLRYGSTCSSMLFHVYTIFTALKHALFREVREPLRQDAPASRPVLSKACRWGWYGMTTGSLSLSIAGTISISQKFPVNPIKSPCFIPLHHHEKHVIYQPLRRL